MIGYNQIENNTVDTDRFASEPIRDILLRPLVKNQLFFREVGNPIPFSKELASFIKEQVHLAFMSKDARFYDPPMWRDSPSANGELKRFICALYSYLDPRNFPKQTLSDLTELIPNIDATDYLKDLRFISMVKTGMGNGRVAQTDPGLEKLKPLILGDIGQIFNYRHWIFWDKEDPGDEKWCNEPLNEVSEDLLKEYREALWSVLPEHCEAIDRNEILLQVTGSGAVPVECEGNSKVYIQKANRSTNTFDSGPLRAKLVYVQKCPGDTRRASVLTVPQSNTVKYIEKQLSVVAEGMTDSLYVKNSEEFDRRYQDFYKTHNRFLCRDIKKDGLTKPRYLVTETMKVICAKYPYLTELDRYKYFYNDWSYYLSESPDKVIHPPRGIGLGMFSAGTTIMQCAVKRMTTNRMLRDGELSIRGSIGGAFYHDDAAIGAEFQDDLDNYDSEESIVFKDLGLIKNFKKTFEANEFVLCEKYSGVLDRKRSYQLTLLNAPFFACNITQAKDMLQQAIKFKTEFDIREWLSDYVRYWGHEFDPEESLLPYNLGGWIPAEYKGVDTTFVWYDYEQHRLHQSLLIACNVHKLERPLARSFREEKTVYNSPLEQLLGPNLSCGGQESFFHYKVPFGEVHQLMSNFNGEGALLSSYCLLNKKRVLRFNQEMETGSICGLADLYDMYCESKQFKDVLPPSEIAHARSLVEFEEDMDYDPDFIYEGQNGKMSFLAFHNARHPALSKVIPSPMPPLFSLNQNKQLTNEERRLATHVQGLLGGHYGVHRQTIIDIPKGSYNFSSTNWVKPYNVAAAWTAYNHIPGIPTRTPRRGVWEDIADYRNSIFNRWYSKTKYRELFTFCVETLGFEFMAKEEYMTDEFYEELLFELTPDYANVAEPPPIIDRDDPMQVPLPRQDIFEIIALEDGIHVPLRLWMETGFGTIDDSAVFRGYNSGYNTPSDNEEIDETYDELNAMQFSGSESSSALAERRNYERQELIAAYRGESVSGDTESAGDYESISSSDSSEEDTSSKSFDPGGVSD